MIRTDVLSLFLVNGDDGFTIPTACGAFVKPSLDGDTEEPFGKLQTTIS